MSAVISPEIKKQYLDSNGDPLSGGKLYIYEAGTTTEATSYNSEEADSVNTNPIILNSNGEIAGLFLIAGSYKFVLKDSSDTTIWTQDNITVRNFGAEIDSLTTTVNSTAANNTNTNRIVSGAKSTQSSRARYLVPLGTSNEVKILGSTTALVYEVVGTQYTVTSDVVASGLITAPTSNNTALVNRSTLLDQNYTKFLGERNTFIHYDTAGSEITGLDGKMAAFKIVGTGTEYFIAKVNNALSVLEDAMRGCFYDKNGNAIERVAFSDNDIITLMNLTWVYLDINGIMIVSYTEPVYSATQPSAPSDGDMWFDMTNNKWKRFNSTAFVDSEATYIGMCIQDENGNTVGARPEDFYVSHSDKNTFSLEYESATKIKSKKRFNKISVFGNELVFKNTTKAWDITSNLESGQSESASTFYYAYIKENGDSVISETPPHKLDDFGGFYHSFEAWRCIGYIFNNSSSNFDEVTYVDIENIFIGTRYTDDTGQGIGTSTDTLKFQNEDFDTCYSYNPATGICFIPISDYYLIHASYRTASVALTTAQKTDFVIDKNGSTLRSSRVLGNGATTNYFNSITLKVYLKKGSEIKIQANSSAATTIETSNIWNEFSITLDKR